MSDTDKILEALALVADSIKIANAHIADSSKNDMIDTNIESIRDMIDTGYNEINCCSVCLYAQAGAIYSICANEHHSGFANLVDNHELCEYFVRKNHNRDR